MAASMHVVWSPTVPGRVVYETHSIEVGNGEGAHATVRSESYDVLIRSRAHAEEIAAEKGYELLRQGEAWESLPEE